MEVLVLQQKSTLQLLLVLLSCPVIPVFGCDKQ